MRADEMLCMGANGKSCKRTVKHYNSKRCKQCAREHELTRKRERRERIKEGDYHPKQYVSRVKEKLQSVEKETMGVKDYSRLIDAYKNLPE